MTTEAKRITRDWETKYASDQFVECCLKCASFFPGDDCDTFVFEDGSSVICFYTDSKWEVLS